MVVGTYLRELGCWHKIVSSNLDNNRFWFKIGDNQQLHIVVFPPPHIS